MSRFSEVEMSQSRPPKVRGLRCGDGRNSSNDHDEHARGRSGQDGAGRGRQDAADGTGRAAARALPPPAQLPARCMRRCGRVCRSSVWVRLEVRTASSGRSTTLVWSSVHRRRRKERAARQSGDLKPPRLSRRPVVRTAMPGASTMPATSSGSPTHRCQL